MFWKRSYHRPVRLQEPDERGYDVEEGNDELKDSCNVLDDLLIFLMLHNNSFREIYF